MEAQGAQALQFFIACVTAAGFGIAVAAFGCGLAQGMGLKAAVEGIARNPESSGKVTVTMLIGLGMGIDQDQGDNQGIDTQRFDHRQTDQHGNRYLA